MGHWETQHGEITLPSAEFAAVRQMVQKATHDHQSKVFDETQAFWKGLTRKDQTDPAAYTAALRNYTDAKYNELYAHQDRPSWNRPTKPSFTEEFVNDVEWRLTLPRDRKPARVLKADLPFPTNRTTDFYAGEGEVRFDKDTNIVHWDTGQNRNAIDRARNSVAGAALFNRLKTVKWTRSTGGVILGNNEHASEEGVPDRCMWRSDRSALPRCEEYTESKGNRVTQRDFVKLQQELWDAKRKLQNRMAKAAGRGKTTAASNRGSFASYAHAEPTIQLGGW